MQRVLVGIVCAALGWLAWRYIIPHKHLAPDGTFFLVQRVTKPTDFGVYSLGPGTEVHRVAQQGTKLTVSDGQQQFEVDALQLTNDLDIAAEIQENENEGKRQTREAIEREKRRIEDLRAQTFIDNAKNTAAHEEARKRAVRPRSALDRGAYDRKEDVARGPQIYSHQVDRGVPIPRNPSSGLLYNDRYGRYWLDQHGGKHYLPPH